MSPQPSSKARLHGAIGLGLVLLSCQSSDPPRATAPGQVRQGLSQAAVKVGVLNKPTGGAPASQTVPHGLGEIPKAIIFWTVGAPTSGFTANELISFGYTDGTSSFSTNDGTLDGVATSSSAKGLGLSPIRLVSGANNILADAAFVGWNATDFNLNWTTNNAVPARVHFLAIGGTAVRAKVLNWTAPGSATTKAITGVGFRPDVVFHAAAGSTPMVPPANLAFGHNSVGVMSADGQWVVGHYDEHGFNPSRTSRWQSSNACIEHGAIAGDSFSNRAVFSSLDADGFSVTYTLSSGAQTHYGSLALSGIPVKVGSFSKITSGSMQAIAGIGFQPGALLLAGVHNVSAPGTLVANSYLGFGASDGTSSGSTSEVNIHGVSPTIAHVYDSTSAAFTQISNATQAIDAQATLAGFGADGFTLNWGINNAIATQIAYVAFGSLTDASTQPLTIDLIAPLEVRCGGSLVLPGGGRFTAGGQLADWSFEGAVPEGALLENDTGRLTWTAPYRPTGPYAFTVRAANSNGTDTFTLRVNVACDSLRYQVSCSSPSGRGDGILWGALLLVFWRSHGGKTRRLRPD
jgi:hypothetical protein